MKQKAIRNDSRIVVPYGAGGHIARLMGVTRTMVSLALNGRVHTKTAERIRFRALNDFKGVEVMKNGKVYTNNK